MTARSCADCGAPLEAADVVCLLGHLAPGTAAGGMAELRAQVNEAFAAAESQLQVLTSSIMAPAIPPPAPQPRVAPPPPPPPAPPPPPPPVLYKPLPTPEEDRLDDPIAAFAPAARLDWGPGQTAASRAADLRKRFNK